MIERYQRCSSFQFYIKPQPLYECVPSCFVVPHSNSTSNHNVEETTLRSPQLFLIPILHQTTTDNRVLSLHSGCSSFQFYIKPQHMSGQGNDVPCCFSFQFYIKPQRPCKRVHLRGVVSHSNSTSNHNLYGGEHIEDIVVSHSNSTSNHNILSASNSCLSLFLIPILHQTTTTLVKLLHLVMLFLIPILHQTTTIYSRDLDSLELFLIPILHQTTTFPLSASIVRKLFLIPILHQTTTTTGRIALCRVVSHSNSTSNHNYGGGYLLSDKVVSHSNSTSNHNWKRKQQEFYTLFLIPILHQTTTCIRRCSRQT